MLERRYGSASRIDGVVVEKLKSGPQTCLEHNPSQLFDLTYITEDLQTMLRSLSRRFSPNNNENSPDLILTEGVRDQGKSYNMILTYHLFANPDHARPW